MQWPCWDSKHLSERPGVLNERILSRGPPAGPDDPHWAPGVPSAPIHCLSVGWRWFWPRNCLTNYITLSAPLLFPPRFPFRRKGCENPSHPNQRVRINLWPPSDVCGSEHSHTQPGPINTSLLKQKLFWRAEMMAKWHSTMALIVSAGGAGLPADIFSNMNVPPSQRVPFSAGHFAVELR